MKAHRIHAIATVLWALYFSATGCSKSPDVAVVTVQRSSVESIVSSVTSGTVRAEQVAELAFGSVGRVRQLTVKLGDHVKEGAILAQVENDDLLSRMRVAAEELERATKLYQGNALSRSAFIQAQGAFEAARIGYEKSIIKAPYDGIIAELNLEVGQLSQITAVLPVALIRIIDTKPRYIRAEIDEVDLSKVQMGMSARARILAVTREPFAAKVRKIVPFVSSIREQDRTSEVELEVESRGELLPPGASADVEIVTEVKDSALTLAPKAILGRGAERYVYRVKDGVARKTPVEVGLSSYAATEIVRGVSEGDEVVLPSDKFELHDGMSVSVGK
jgi:HlyD family secretion protein